MSQIFKILFQTGDVNIVDLRGVIWSRYAQLKSYFSDKKTSSVKSDTNVSREAIGNYRGKILKKPSIIDRSWSPAKSLIDIFSFFEFKVRTCSFQSLSL